MKYLVCVTLAICSAVVSGKIVYLEEGAELDGGEWTAWLNSPYSRRYGDFENIYKYRNFYNEMEGSCDMWCDEPLAIEYKLTERYAGAEKCVNLEETDMTTGTFKGFNCYNRKQEENQQCTREECQAAGMYSMSFGDPDATCNMCPDFMVRYYCTEEKPASLEECLNPDAMQQNEATRELLETLDPQAREQLMARSLQKKRQMTQESTGRSQLISLLRELLEQ